MPSAFPPKLLIISTASSTFFLLLELMITVAPSRASLLEISKPIPVEEAVTTTTLPVNL